ncbi:3-keto-disaccharide hydrolase [Kribbella sp. GL6]|uniref:3-keto-disaccharide hydrolase n=1 Tax=Kribbella sp. GL6 TaxID=3419765 RepID=UPI003CFC25B7
MELFDGKTLNGWYAVPRTYDTLWPGGPPVRELLPDLAPDYEREAAAHPARWEVVDGAIEGFQDPDHPGYGGYLVTEQTFGDFELTLEMKPDWPADTGVMIRRRPDNWAGFQVLVDHRKSGSIGGFFGNGTGGFHAVPYVLDACKGRLRIEDPTTSVEPMTPDKPARLTRRGDPQEFLTHWRNGDWNSLRIRCIGAKPLITTWVNDVLVAEIDLATMQHPRYDADAVAEALGPTGHIALEVHDNDPHFGEARWARGARCRWRNLTLTALSLEGAH